jgi:hypothetical protein
MGAIFTQLSTPVFSSSFGDEPILLILRHFWPLLERIFSSDHMQNGCLSTAVCKALSQAIQASGILKQVSIISTHLLAFCMYNTRTVISYFHELLVFNCRSEFLSTVVKSDGLPFKKFSLLPTS